MTAPLPEWLGPLAAAVLDGDATGFVRFPPPEDGSGRASAVLIALADTERGPSVLLIERAADMRKHPGQVAFPGGQLDPGDESSAGAALREANEEVGLDAGSIVVIAELPAVYIPVSGFVVTPVLAWWREPHPVLPAVPAEVARVGLLPLAELADPANRFWVTHPSGWVGPGFDVDGFFVWGFTAGLVDQLLEFGGWARPWADDADERPLPASMIRR